jgi:hypothetical protein
METIKNRMALCEKSIDETFSQIKLLQSKHQQLIGYKQALSDIITDLESESLRFSTESISPNNEG